MIGWIIFSAIWLGVGYINGGIVYAYGQLEYPNIAKAFQEEDYKDAWLTAGLPALGIFIALLCSPWRHGICWNWITKPDLSAPSQNPQNGQVTVAAIQQATQNAMTLTLAQVRASVAALKSNTPYFPPDLPRKSGTECITAYRVWKLNRETGHLVSTYMNDYEWPFRRRLVSDDFDSRGVHAVKSIERLYKDRLVEPSIYDPAGLGDEKSLWNSYAADVAGEVYLWGEVKEHALGYTAQFAYPKQLWVPVDTDPLVIMQLEENYGVPVSERKEFKKHVAVPDANLSWPATFNLSPIFTCTVCGYYSFVTSCANPACSPAAAAPSTRNLCSYCGQPLSSLLCCMNSSCLYSPNYSAVRQANMQHGAQTASAAAQMAQASQASLLAMYKYAIPTTWPWNTKCKVCLDSGCAACTPPAPPNPTSAIVPYKP